MSIDLSSPVIPARYAMGLMNSAEAKLASPTRLAKEVGIKLETLHEAGSRITAKQYSRLFATITRELSDESCGLLPRPMPIGSIELMCRSLLTTKNLEECIPVAAKAFSVITSAYRSELSPESNGAPARLFFHEIEAIQGDRFLAYEISIFTLVGVLSWLFGQRVPIASLHFPFAKPDYALTLSMLLATPLCFDSEAAHLEFEEGAMDMAVIRNPGEISDFLRRAPATQIESLIGQGGLPARLQAMFQQHLPSSLTIEEAASELAMSPRTLHRKLAALGMSFQNLKDDWRFRKASHLLSFTDVPVKQIASDLGFSDQASFRRAFSIWAGHPPGELRKAR